MKKPKKTGRLPLARTLAATVQRAASRDAATVDDRGRPVPPAIAGVLLTRLTAHHDDRGSLTPVFDARQPFWVEPVIYAYSITIRPGRIKGWGMHRLQADRYFACRGSIRVVLFDGRPDSPTCGRFAEFYFTDASPGLLRIPPGVWHADQNWGDGDAVVINFPTRAYDPRAPDKQRIDPHSGVIPFDWRLRDG
jgi:dTDP-4-dehydrorhamnose 3,5-epimerase